MLSFYVKVSNGGGVIILKFCGLNLLQTQIGKLLPTCLSKNSCNNNRIFPINPTEWLGNMSRRHEVCNIII